MRRIPAHWRLPIVIGVVAALCLIGGTAMATLRPFSETAAKGAATPTVLRTIPGHTVTRLKKVRVRVVKYRHGKRIVSYQTVTRPVSVFVPPTTVVETGPGRTTTRTVDGTIFRTVTTPGQTVTQTLPGSTVTDTLPGSTVTDTLPGSTITEPGTTVTQTCTVDTNGATIGCS